MGTGQELYKKARALIPGGTQLLSKRPERFLPDQWPAYYSKSQGASIWDLDGIKYLDMASSGIGSCVLGYADPDVDRAAIEAIKNGSMSFLNSPTDVELGNLLCELHPWANQVRFARGGGEAMSIAVRIARASTGREKIAFCGYHGWHDWYLAANLAEEQALDGHLLPGLSTVGVPRGLTGTALPFNYNRLDELEQIVSQNPGELAAIIMEPSRNRGPATGFLERIRALATRLGSVLVFDEVSSGLRMNTGGVHLTYGVNPDIAVFAKALSNGYPMAAVIGVEEVMESAQSTFISSTSWTEGIGPAAALATLKKHRRLEVGGHLIDMGQRVQTAWQEAADRTGIKIRVEGLPPMSHLIFDYRNGLELETLYTQLMLEKGILASGMYWPSLAHTEKHLDRFFEAMNQAFRVCARAVNDGQVESLLKGPVRHADFHRLT